VRDPLSPVGERGLLSRKTERNEESEDEDPVDTVDGVDEDVLVAAGELLSRWSGLESRWSGLEASLDLPSSDLPSLSALCPFRA
jgi:hypothetical protein